MKSSEFLWKGGVIRPHSVAPGDDEQSTGFFCLDLDQGPKSPGPYYDHASVNRHGGLELASSALWARKHRFSEQSLVLYVPCPQCASFQTYVAPEQSTTWASALQFAVSRKGCLATKKILNAKLIAKLLKRI